jgi:hypothetical protein
MPAISSGTDTTTHLFLRIGANMQHTSSVSRSKQLLKLTSVLVMLLLAATSAFPHPAAATNRLQANGTIIADLGFRPATDGFPFPNYGNDADTPITNMTPAEMQRLFGDKVCSSIKDGNCVLTPPAESFMQQVNDAMGGGHCEGLAALSLLLYSKQINVADFGADQMTALTLNANEKLQREIALWWATQATNPAVDAVITLKPSEILDKLIEAYKDQRNITETYTLGIYKRGFKDGHAITPYGVIDLGDGKYQIGIYDNNFPGEERIMDVDRNAETWSYMASINPSEPEALYEGDATTGTLQLTPTKPREQLQVCTFCGDEGSAKVFGRAAEAPQYNQVWLDGSADLLISDEAGNQIGYVDGNFVNTFPDARFAPIKSANLNLDDPEPVYMIPRGKAFEIALSGKDITAEATSSVTMIGAGYDLSVDNVKLEPGQVDSIVFNADGKSLNYKPGGTEAPDLTVGTETKGADYSFTLYGIEVDEGGSVNAGLAMDKGQFAISISDSKEPAAFGIEFSRFDDDGEVTFTSDDTTLASGDIMYIDFANWTGQGATLKVEIDEKGDGTIDQTIELKDNK